MKPIGIPMTRSLCFELAACAEGSYEDMQLIASLGGPCDRPLDSHTHVTATRDADRSLLVAKTREEAEDLYYEVCSGTFKRRSLKAYQDACRIADALRPYAKPETVRMWPKPEKEPFDY